MSNIFAKFSKWNVALFLICLVAFGLLSYAAITDGPNFDEKAHIPAGYTYARFMDYRLNPEHPPLLKFLSGIPLLFLDLKFDTAGKNWNGVNEQWRSGDELMFGGGNDADLIISWARFFPIIFTILTIILIYFVSRKILGEKWAILPTIFFGLSPTVLAHGHYVTTDIAGAFGIILAIFYYSKLLQEPNAKNTWKAGLAFGVAQLTKFSAFLLIPFLILITGIKLIADGLSDPEPDKTIRRRNLRKDFQAWLFRLVGVGLIGVFLVVNAAYFGLSQMPAEKQTADMENIMTSFATGPTPEGQMCKPIRCPADAVIWLSKNPITRPLSWYMMGVLMVVQRSAGGNTNYYMGGVSGKGTASYFPTVYALKETLPALLFVLSGLLLGAYAFLKNFRSGKTLKFRFAEMLRERPLEVSLFLFALLYWANSITSPLNIGVRHVLPTIPMLYILAASAWKRKMDKSPTPNVLPPQTPLPIMSWKDRILASKGKLAIAIMLIWFGAEVAAASPNYLSYYNQLAGGTKNGYRYATDSNYDWGQDIERFAKWLKEHTEVDKIAFHYFGGGQMSYYLGEKAETWWSSRGNPKEGNIKWFAISVNELQGHFQKPRAGFERKPEDAYLWLKEGREMQPGLGGVPKPDYIAGTSIFIYKL